MESESEKDKTLVHKFIDRFTWRAHCVWKPNVHDCPWYMQLYRWVIVLILALDSLQPWNHSFYWQVMLLITCQNMSEILVSCYIIDFFMMVGYCKGLHICQRPWLLTGRTQTTEGDRQITEPVKILKVNCLSLTKVFITLLYPQWISLESSAVANDL